MARIRRWVLLTLWVWIVLEAGAWFALGRLTGESMGYAVLRGRQEALASHELRTDEALPEGDQRQARNKRNRRAEHQNEIRHPFLGFVGENPAVNEGDGVTYLVSERLGDPSSIPFQAEPFVVGIAGGSVATNLVRYQGTLILETLRSSPQLEGREVHLVCVGNAGHKQPQSLLSLTFLRSLGIQFDAVMVLDGFNEVGLHLGAARRTGQHPAYPRQWVTRVGLDRAHRSTLGRLDLLEAERASRARDMLSSPLHYSWLRQLAWYWKDRGQNLAIERLKTSLTDSGKPSLESTGPQRQFEDDAEMLNELADLWERCGRMMQALCDEDGATYLHFLQPNQYDLEPDEPVPPKSRSFDPKFKPFPLVQSGYPLLRERGAGMLADGIRFFDLKDVLEGPSDLHYSDTCCHLNPLASAQVAIFMTDALLASIP